MHRGSDRDNDKGKRETASFGTTRLLSVQRDHVVNSGRVMCIHLNHKMAKRQRMNAPMQNLGIREQTI